MKLVTLGAKVQTLLLSIAVRMLVFVALKKH